MERWTTFATSSTALTTSPSRALGVFPADFFAMAFPSDFARLLEDLGQVLRRRLLRLLVEVEDLRQRRDDVRQVGRDVVLLLLRVDHAPLPGEVEPELAAALHDREPDLLQDLRVV